MVKIPVKKTQVKVTKKKDEVQLTLQTAFEAGRLYKEAKELKQKALMGQNVIQVGGLGILNVLNKIDNYLQIFKRGIFRERTSFIKPLFFGRENFHNFEVKKKLILNDIFMF